MPAFCFAAIWLTGINEQGGHYLLFSTYGHAYTYFHCCIADVLSCTRTGKKEN